MTTCADLECGGSQSLTGLARLKVRKPYTITKQRERWTDSEHELFLEALKLYGRAWRSIQEHIGTKTTVQIRSHAQKFFTKLEKHRRPQEAVSEDEVHVPPPRQKQKSRQVSEVQHALASSQLDTAPCDKEVKNQQQQTAAEVAAAAGVVAAAAALQVIQAAGEQVEAQLQASPPKGFPFFGMTPSALSRLSTAELQLSKAGSLSDATCNSLLRSAQLSVANSADEQVTAAGSIDAATGSARAQGAATLLPAQRLKSGDRSSNLSETLSDLPVAAANAATTPPGHPSPPRPTSSGATTLTHSHSGEGSSRMDEDLAEAPPSGADTPLAGPLETALLSSRGATEPAGAGAQSGRGASQSDRGTAQPARGVTGPGRGIAQSERGTTQPGRGVTGSVRGNVQSGGKVTNDSSHVCSSKQAADREASQEMADALLLASVAASAIQHEAHPPAPKCDAGGHGGDAWQFLNAATQHAQQASCDPQLRLPGLYNQQMQQAMATWGPYLALYQMQAMLGSPAGSAWAADPARTAGAGVMYPQPPLGSAADQYAWPAQHAQQALMMAVQAMAAGGSSGLPQSLGIAMGAGAGRLPPILGRANSSPQGLVSSSLPGHQSTWPSSDRAANPFGVPLPASAINPSWLDPQSHANPRPTPPGSDVRSAVPVKRST